MYLIIIRRIGHVEWNDRLRSKRLRLRQLLGRSRHRRLCRHLRRSRRRLPRRRRDGGGVASALCSTWFRLRLAQIGSGSIEGRLYAQIRRVGSPATALVTFPPPYLDVPVSD